MPYSMQGAYAKLDRAEQHLEQLRAEMRAGAGSNGYGFSFTTDIQTREHVVIYRMSKDLSIRYGILAGEVISQARSALDHAVCNLVPNLTRRTGFPVVRYQADYPSQRKLKTDGINNAAAAIIESLQPFNSGGALSPLWILNELWNADKHRVLNLVGAAATAYKRVYPQPDGTTVDIVTDIPRGKFEDGAEVIRIKHPDFYRPHMHLVTHLECCLKFQDVGPAPDQEITELITKLLKFGKDVTESLVATA